MSTTSWTKAMMNGIDAVISPRPSRELRREMDKRNQERLETMRHLSRSTRAARSTSTSSSKR